MLKAIVIDDELHCLETLAILLKEYCPGVQVLATCKSAAEGLKVIEEQAPDVVFLDIEMPGMNGFQMLEQINDISFAVVFTTSYDQYAIKAIRFSALDYLLKPIDPRELIAAVTKVKTQQNLPLSEQFELLLQHFKSGQDSIKKIAVPTLEGYEMILAEDIIRCEASDNYCFLYLKNNRKMVASRTLKQLEEQLASLGYFLRVHHSFVVNLNEVIRYTRGEGGYLQMSDGSNVNVARSRKPALMRLL